MQAEKGPNQVTYAVQHMIPPEKLFQGLTDDVKQQFKRAINALRLNAPHADLWVENEESELQANECCSSDVSSEMEGDYDENRGKRPHLEPHPAESHVCCADCEDAFRWFVDSKTWEPKLMMLGSGELNSYSVE